MLIELQIRPTAFPPGPSQTSIRSSHLVCMTPGLSGAINLAGYPWSMSSEVPSSSRAIKVRSSAATAGVTMLTAYVPRSAEIIRTPCDCPMPAVRSRSRSRTPVQVADCDQPSTQPIGSTAVVCGSARNCTSVKERSPVAPASVRR